MFFSVVISKQLNVVLYLCGVHKPFTLPWEETVPARDKVLPLLSRSLGPAAMLKVSLIKSGPPGPLLATKTGPLGPPLATKTGPLGPLLATKTGPLGPLLATKTGPLGPLLATKIIIIKGWKQEIK